MEKVCFETRGLAGLGCGGGNKETLEKRFVSGRETNVSEPWEKVSFRVGNKGRKQTFQRPARKTKVSKLQLQVSDTRAFPGQVRSKFVSAMAKHCFTCRQKCKTTTAVSFSRHALLWYVCQGCTIPFRIGKSFATCRSSGWSYHFEQNPLQNEVGGVGGWNIPPTHVTPQQGWRDAIPKPFMLLQRPPRSQ